MLLPLPSSLFPNNQSFTVVIKIMAYSNFGELLVWQKAMQLSKKIYELTVFLPKEELFALTSQMKRAAVSIPSNIAEGSSRNTTKDYINFLSIARGSNSELWTQILLCKELNYLAEEQIFEAIHLCEEISKMLNTMIIKLSEKIN